MIQTTVLGVIAAVVLLSQSSIRPGDDSDLGQLNVRDLPAGMLSQSSIRPGDDSDGVKQCRELWQAYTKVAIQYSPWR